MMSGHSAVRWRRPAVIQAAAAAVVALTVFVALLVVPDGSPSAPPTPTPRAPALVAATSVTATTASSLLGIVGINIHSAEGSTPYGNYPATEKLLLKLGLHHIRDDMAYNPNFVRSAQYAFYNTLDAAGIKTDLVVSPSAEQTDLAGRLASVATYFPTAVDALEGPNELNLAPGDTEWASQDQSYAKALAASVRANPTLKSIPLLAPSLADYLAIHDHDQGFLQLGDLTSSITLGNVHLYPGGRDPTWNMDVTLAGVPIVSGTKPVWVTEAGYHDEVTTPGRDAAAPDPVIAAYLPRLLLEWAQRGVARVNLYELYDEAADPDLVDFQDHFGLVALDGKPKPQFYAVANFDHLLSDKDSSFVPGALSYSLSSGTTPVSTKLVEKSDGEFVLFVWRDVSLYDTTTQQLTPVTGVPVTVTLADPAQRLEVFRPSVSGRPQQTVTAASSITFSVGGDVSALVVKP